jgi:xanthine dehydrogenase accessory factor
MRELVPTILRRLAAGEPVVYCRLVETRGSTPQKPGAVMLVFPDGSQAGTLGGGCVEAEVKRRSLATFAEGSAEILTFQLDSDYGWDDGLICGGRMQVLVEPLRPGDDATYFERLQSLISTGSAFCEAIVFDAGKSGIAAPTCWLLDAEGRVLAARHTTAAPPATVVEQMPALADRPRACNAGGVAYLPMLERCRLLIVGGGHLGQAVGNLAPDLGFDVWVVDDREEYVSRERFPRAERLLCGEIGPTLKGLEVTPSTYCLIVTRGHNHDEEALFNLCERGARYVGMIGSRRKIKLIFDDLESEGVSPESLAKVYAPLGINIGSQTVMEIAISILAELIAHRNLNGEVPGRPASVLADVD